MNNLNEAMMKMLLSMARSHYMRESERSDIFKSYLKERKISQDTAFQLGIGYADSGNSLSELLKTETDLWGVAEEAGLVWIRDGSLEDRFSGRIMYSLNDRDGNCVGFAGHSNSRPPKFLITPESCVYNKSKYIYGIEGAKIIETKGTVLVVEGFSDYVAIYEKGIMNVVATMGRLLSEEQIKELHAMASEIILGFDGDEVGKKATMRTAEAILKMGITPYVIDYGAHRDAKSFMENEPEAVKKIKDKMNLSKKFSL